LSQFPITLEKRIVLGKLGFLLDRTGPKRRAPRATYSTIRSAADGKVFLKKRDINQFQPETTEKKVEI